MITTRQYLRFYSKDNDGRVILRKLFQMAKDEGSITEIEYWALIYTYADCRIMRDNTCAKLNMSSTKLATTLNEALIKIDYTINKLDKLRNL